MESIQQRRWTNVCHAKVVNSDRNGLGEYICNIHCIRYGGFPLTNLVKVKHQWKTRNSRLCKLLVCDFDPEALLLEELRISQI